jgi:flavodoxin
VLICWFSWGGYTKRVVDILKSRLNADLYEIETEVVYKGFMGFFRGITHSIKGPGSRGQHLVNPLPDLSVYDVFIVACPVWNYAHPAPVSALLAAANFSGKPVIGLPTCQSNMRRFNDLLAPEVTTGRFIAKDAIYNIGWKSGAALEEEVTRWLVGL